MRLDTAIVNGIDILLVEDNPGDVRLTREALKESCLNCRVNVAEDGDAALDYLHQRGRFIDASRPDLILLDLNLPKRNGTEVLREIKGDPKMRRIPVIVLTSSRAEPDIFAAYDHGANCYVRKPGELDGFCSMIHDLEEFWMQWAVLPSS